MHHKDPGTLNQSPTPLFDGQAIGEALKDHALDQHEKRHGPHLLLRARRVLLSHLLSAQSCTADVVALALGDNAIDSDRRLLGAVPKELIRLGLIRRDGYAASRRPVAHARPISVWTLVDRPGALKWLASHPEPAEGREGES